MDLVNTTMCIYGKTIHLFMGLLFKTVSCYIAHCPVLVTAQSALHFTPCSFQRHFDSSGKHSPMLQLLSEDYSFRYPPQSIARYSFIQLSELWQNGMNETAKVSKRQQEDSNPGSLDREPYVRTATLPRPSKHTGRILPQLLVTY